jgi:hypothetical protein
MNQGQKSILIIAAIIVLLMLVYPPFVFIGANGVRINAGYAPIFQPPIYPDPSRLQASVNTIMLITQIFAVGVVAGLLTLAFKGRRSA